MQPRVIPRPPGFRHGGYYVGGKRMPEKIKTLGRPVKVAHPSTINNRKPR